jgi:phosphohistidine swiveling domain-containing protein
LSTRFILRLSSDVALSSQNVGAKCSNLAALGRFGLPVRDGLCLTSEVCARRDRNLIASLIDNALTDRERGVQFVVRRSVCDEGDEGLGPASAPSSVSAVALSGGGPIADAVMACLRSIPPRDGAFWLPAGRRDRNPPAAVLIQEHVRADLLGVAYSRNPITAADEVIVEGHRPAAVAHQSEAYAVAHDGEAQSLMHAAPVGEISPAQLRMLCDLVRRAESALKYPCRIDWLIEGDDVWITNAQRISASVPEMPQDEWTRANIGEVVPDRLTPLSYAAWARPMQLLFRSSFRYLRVPADSFQFISNQSGQLWYNIGAINYLSSKLGLPTIDLAIGTGSVGTRARSGSRLHPGRMLRHAVGLARTTIAHLRLPSAVSKASRELPAIARKYAKAATDATSPRACLDLAGQCYAETEPFLAVYSDATSAAFGTLALLETAALRWLPPEFSVASLLSSSGAEVAGAGQALWELKRNPHDRELARDFFERFGHRGWQEVEFMNPTWREIDPTLWGVQPAQANPRPTPRPAANVPATRYRLTGLRRLVCENLIEHAKSYAILRENIKHEFFRPIDAIRQLLRKAGNMLASDGVIASEQDIYFLTISELHDLISATKVAELCRLAKLRRILWERARPEPRENSSSAVERLVTLRGLGASGGRAAGHARVLRSPREISAVRSGDILVAEVLDVGWFPLFAIVGGVVTSLGGVLSHPAIVARECGLPAVVGISGVTERVPDGAWLVVDGDRGIVEMHPTHGTASQGLQEVEA